MSHNLCYSWTKEPVKQQWGSQQEETDRVLTAASARCKATLFWLVQCHNARQYNVAQQLTIKKCNTFIDIWPEVFWHSWFYCFCLNLCSLLGYTCITCWFIYCLCTIYNATSDSKRKFHYPVRPTGYPSQIWLDSVRSENAIFPVGS